MVSGGCMGTNWGIHEYMYGVSQQRQEEEKGQRQEESNENPKKRHERCILVWLCFWVFGSICLVLVSFVRERNEV